MLLMKICIGMVSVVNVIVVSSIVWFVFIWVFLCRYYVFILLIMKQVVMNDFSVMCVRWYGKEGLNIICYQFCGCMMLLISLQLVGVCSQLLDERIQNVENSVFSVIMQVEKKCRCGDIWFQLNIIMFRKLVFRKKVVSILQVSSGLIMLLVILFSCGQFVLNWKVIMMLLIMFMLKDMVKIFCQKKYSLCYIGLWVCS